MKSMAKLISLFMIISILGCFSLAVSAAPANTVYSDFWVNAGGSTYETTTSATTATRKTCYMRLRWFKFQYFPDSIMPGGDYIYSRLYTPLHTQASNYASFSGVTPVGSYNYSYLSGFGGSGQSYVIKSNSSYTLTGYWVKLDWSANPY